MTSMLVSTWYLTALRGILAVCFVLLCLVQASIDTFVHVDTFGVYALADGSLCALSGIAAKGRRGSLVLLPSSIAGLTVGLYLISASSVTAMTRAAAIAVWSLAAGVSALNIGCRLFLLVPSSLRVIELAIGAWVRRGAAMEWGIVVAGVDAVAFATIALALSISGRALPVALIGLFIGIFGYLHLRVGLSLGILALSAQTSTTNVENGEARTLTVGCEAPVVRGEEERETPGERWATSNR